MITYEIGGKLYINMTNRCTNSCSFCIRTASKTFEYDLWLDREPDVSEIIAEIGTADKYDEVVFCGFGEPMIRLPELLEVAGYLKQLGKKVGVNTNGHADLIWRRKVASDLEGLVDSISISLNAADSKRYQELCSPQYGERAYQAVIEFAQECLKYIPEVTLSVVDIISDEEIKKAEETALKTGAVFRVRHMQD